MDDATLVKPRNIGYILRSVKSDDEHRLEGEMIVGREVECAIAIESGHISRYHAKINVMRSGVYIEDLHSTNGTFINGKRIKGRVRLSLGDEVTFDDVAYRVTSNQSGQQEQTLLSPMRAAPKEEDDDTRRPQPVQPAPKPAAAKSNVEPFPPVARESVKPARAKSDSKDELGLIHAHVDFAPQAKPLLKEPPSPPAQAETSDNDASDEQENERTRMLSTSQIDQYAERNRVVHRDISPGRGPRLIIMTAPLRGKYFEVSEDIIGDSWQIGRAPESHIHLTDKTISSDHARLAKVPDGYQLKATHAKNGILVNGVPSSSTLLEHNDKIQIGSTELIFKTDDPEVVEAPPAKDSLIDSALNMRHTLIGAAVILVVLITVIFASNS